MSYYWAVPGPSTAPTSYSVVGAQSSLHQERAYLLNVLAAEESRREQLTSSRDAARQKLAAVELAEGSADEVKSLKKAVTGIARKLKRSQKSSKAMISNLAAVTSRMQMLERHQWRRAQLEYSQRYQLPQLNDMNMNMQNLTLVSPMTPTYQLHAQSPISPQTPALAYPIPLTPMTNIRWASGYGDGWGSPLYTPFYAQTYEQVQPSHQGQLETVPSPFHDGELWHPAGQASDSRHLRTMSLPMIRHRGSWVGSGSHKSIAEDEAISPKSGMNLARKLSLIGGGSSGLRLESLVE